MSQCRINWKIGFVQLLKVTLALHLQATMLGRAPPLKSTLTPTILFYSFSTPSKSDFGPLFLLSVSARGVEG